MAGVAPPFPRPRGILRASGYLQGPPQPPAPPCFTRHRAPAHPPAVMEMVLRKPSLIIAGRRFSKVGSPGSLAQSSPLYLTRPRIAASRPPTRRRTPRRRGPRPCSLPRTWSSSRGEFVRFVRCARWLIRRRRRNLEKLSSGVLKRWQRRFFQVSGHYLRYFDVSEGVGGGPRP